MAEIVLLAAAPLPVVVVCDDDEVRSWAERSGARVVWCPGRGLNGAVADGVAALAADGVERAVVAHADLPLATRLAWVADFDGVTLVPDRRLDGTNVVGVPTGAGFAFAYGAGSFGRHRAEAARLGLPVRIVRGRRPGLGRRPARRPRRWAGPGRPATAGGRRAALARSSRSPSDRAGVRVDLPTPASALAIGAHPDDVEFGCGATLAKWARRAAWSTT